MKDDSGAAQQWALELLPNPAQLIHNGWSRVKSAEAMKAGTPVMVTVAPSKAGGIVGLCLRVADDSATVLLAQGQRAAGAAQGQRRAGAARPADTRPFNAHEIGGIWSRNAKGFGGGTCADCGDRGYSLEWPEFTPEGQAAFDKNIPSYGREKDSADAKAHPEEHIGRRRAQPPALGNDLYGQCDAQGIPRALLYPDPVEFHQLGDRVLQHFEWHYELRTIWTDGRKLPALPVDLPRWWGYAVGRWDGDTFVVESTGYEERTCVDYFGYPHSDEMRLEERYRRTSYDTLELNMTVTDPKYYAKPWKSQTKRFKRCCRRISSRLPKGGPGCSRTSACRLTNRSSTA